MANDTYLLIDGIVTNMNAIKLLGCKFGYNLDSINASYTLEWFDCELYFIVDPCDMLKLIRIALTDFGTSIDVDHKMTNWKDIRDLQ